MWEEGDTNERDKPDSVLAFSRSSAREHRFGHKINTVFECSEEEEEEEEEEENSSDEEYLRYNTSFPSSLAELAYSQSGPVDSVINSFLTSEGQTPVVSSKQQFNVLVHAQTTGEILKENGEDPPSFVVEKSEVKNVSEIDNLSTGTNSYDILSSPSLHPSPRSDIPVTVTSADVISASKPATSYTTESGYIERATETSSLSNSVSTSQQEKSESDKEVYNSDLHIEEEDYPTHENQGEKDIFIEFEDKLNASFSSQSSSASNHTSRPTSLTRYERLSGSEPDTLISKEPGAIRVHSERPGGWEGVSHELVYPLSPEQWRREARRRKWQKHLSKDEVESVSFVISVDRKSSEPTRDRFRTTFHHRTVTVPDQDLPYFKPTSGNVQTVTFGSRSDIYSTDEIPKKMTEKQALVDRSESFEEITKPDKLNKDNFTPLNFQINPAYPVYAQKSPDEHDTVMSVDYTKGVGPSDSDQSSGKGTDSKTSRWDGRINPFNNEEPESEDVFTKGIIDLDDQPETEAGRTKNNARDSDDNEPGTIPSRKSLSDTEEQINLKTQFKDVYYNIGSTEDLLKELAAEDERDGDLGVPSKPRLTESQTISTEDPTEVEEKDITEGKTSKNVISRKGKLLKYESLDLDIDHSNPFYDEVYQEYHRRIDAKQEVSSDQSCPSSKSKKTLDNIPESTSQEMNESDFEPDSCICEQTPVEAVIEHNPEEERKSFSGGQEQDCNPLIEDTTKENKENQNMPFGFLKKKETTAEVEAPKPETDAADSKTTKSAEVIENGETTKESTTPAEDTSKVTVDKADQDGNVAVSFTTSPAEGTDGAEVKEDVQPPKTSAKTEKSPLIEADAIEASDSGKESKVRDHSPGFLCCTIL